MGRAFTKNFNTSMKIISRNCKRAKWLSQVREYIISQNADILLLQEVWELSRTIIDEYPFIIQRTPVNKLWDTQKFHNIIASKYPFWQEIILKSDNERVMRELRHFRNNIFWYKIILENGTLINAILVYSPARPIDKQRAKEIDTTSIRSRNNPDVYVSDILRHSLQENNFDGDRWLIWWDFNLSVSFDKKTKWWRWNQHSIDRMEWLGLKECIVQHNWYTPTFRHSRGWIVDQIDHIFLSESLQNLTKSCVVDKQCLIERISDHAPVIIDLNL